MGVDWEWTGATATETGAQNQGFHVAGTVGKSKLGNKYRELQQAYKLHVEILH